MIDVQMSVVGMGPSLTWQSNITCETNNFINIIRKKIIIITMSVMYNYIREYGKKMAAHTFQLQVMS